MEKENLFVPKQAIKNKSRILQKMMSDIESIFATRCNTCNQLSLKSEKHTCKKYQKRRWLVQDIIQALGEFIGSPAKPETICYTINKKYGTQSYSHFQIKYHMEKHPELFVCDNDGLWHLKD